MAPEAVVQVVGEVDITAGALQDQSAFPADDNSGVAPPVQKKEHLFAPVQAQVHSFYQSPAENTSIAVFYFLTHVHNPDLGQRLMINPVGQLQQPVNQTLAGLEPAFQRRGGASQQDHRPGKLGPFDGYFPGVIAQVILLFIGCFMFLVNYKKPRPGQGSKNC